MVLKYRKIIAFLLIICLVASLILNGYLYNSSSNEKLEQFSLQQYNKVLSDYEQSILSASQFILTQLDSYIEKSKISRKDLLYLYMNYESLNTNQIQYANYVQTYNSPDGKNAIKQEIGNESITLNYVPGFIYFNSSIALCKELLFQATDDNEIMVTPDLEERLQLAFEIIKINTSIYEKYINNDIDLLSNQSILTRLKLQNDLITSSTKLADLDLELSKLEK